MHFLQHTFLALTLATTLAACGDPMPTSAFKDTRPAIDPIRFFTGHVRSWGVLEDRSGQPTDIVTTDCTGTPDGHDGLDMTQTLQIGTDKPTKRQWHMRRTGPATFEATANDMVGTATGEAAGRAFHWQWTLALSPGNSLKNVTMDQWWYLQSDGSLINRTTIRKLGIIAAEVTEHFVPDH
jgi:hypothetical protein